VGFLARPACAALPAFPLRSVDGHLSCCAERRLDVMGDPAGQIFVLVRGGDPDRARRRRPSAGFDFIKVDHGNKAHDLGIAHAGTAVGHRHPAIGIRALGGI
jgi:hypothetical protein